MEALLLFGSGEANRSERDCHGKDSVLLAVPERRGQPQPSGGTPEGALGSVRRQGE